MLEELYALLYSEFIKLIGSIGISIGIASSVFSFLRYLVLKNVNGKIFRFLYLTRVVMFGFVIILVLMRKAIENILDDAIPTVYLGLILGTLAIGALTMRRWSKPADSQHNT